MLLLLMTAAKHPATPANTSALHPAAPPAEHQHTKETQCWTHQSDPPRPLGEDACPHKHVGEAGCMEYLLATEDGFCKRNTRDNCGRGTACKLRHPFEDMAGGSHEKTPDELER